MAINEDPARSALHLLTQSPERYLVELICVNWVVFLSLKHSGPDLIIFAQPGHAEVKVIQLAPKSPVTFLASSPLKLR